MLGVQPEWLVFFCEGVIRINKLRTRAAAHWRLPIEGVAQGVAMISMGLHGCMRMGHCNTACMRMQHEAVKLVRTRSHTIPPLLGP